MAASFPVASRSPLQLPSNPSTPTGTPSSDDRHRSGCHCCLSLSASVSVSLCSPCHGPLSVSVGFTLFESIFLRLFVDVPLCVWLSPSVPVPLCLSASALVLSVSPLSLFLSVSACTCVCLSLPQQPYYRLSLCPSPCMPPSVLQPVSFSIYSIYLWVMCIYIYRYITVPVSAFANRSSKQQRHSAAVLGSSAASSWTHQRQEQYCVPSSTNNP